MIYSYNLNMKLTLDALLVLDAIDRKGSFAAAAGELHRVPSALTYTVQRLEQDLDAALFDRSGHRARLTPAGRKLLDEGRHLLRAAAHLEQTVRRVATGWEAELRIAVDELIPMTCVYPLIEDFYQHEGCGTQLRIRREGLGGTWEALIDGRADLLLGATGEGPAGGHCATRLLGEQRFVFVVAPTHPLASAPEPLSEDTLQRHRAVAAADSSRRLPPRTSALLSGQDVLTLPDLLTKLEAQRLGLGVGYLPHYLVAEDLARGTLIEKTVSGSQPVPQLFAAWRTGENGRALNWFLQRLDDPATCASLIA